jgi:hypothetical protein
VRLLWRQRVAENYQSVDVKIWTGLNDLGEPSIGGVLWNGSSEVQGSLQIKNIFRNYYQ